MSGSPIFHPETNLTGAGASSGFPAAAPVSAHFARVSISTSDKDRSFANLPTCGSANQGGIRFKRTDSRIAFAQGRVSEYVRKDTGAASPGRWQPWQFLWRIGS